MDLAEKDIVPEPVEPGGVHPELGGQVDSQGQSAVHGVVEESPAVRRQRRRVTLGPQNTRDLVHTQWRHRLISHVVFSHHDEFIDLVVPAGRLEKANRITPAHHLHTGGQVEPNVVFVALKSLRISNSDH